MDDLFPMLAINGCLGIWSLFLLISQKPDNETWFPPGGLESHMEDSGLVWSVGPCARVQSKPGTYIFYVLR